LPRGHVASGAVGARRGGGWRICSGRLSRHPPIKRFRSRSVLCTAGRAKKPGRTWRQFDAVFRFPASAKSQHVRRQGKVATVVMPHRREGDPGPLVGSRKLQREREDLGLGLLNVKSGLRDAVLVFHPRHISPRSAPDLQLPSAFSSSIWNRTSACVVPIHIPGSLHAARTLESAPDPLRWTCQRDTV